MDFQKETDKLFDLEKVNNKLYTSLVRILAEFTDGEYLKYSDKLALLESKIRDALRMSGYTQKVEDFLKNFDKINGMVLSDYKEQGLQVQNAIINNDLNKFLLEKTISDLKGNGINEAFIHKVADNIRINTLQGITYEEAANRLQESIVEKPELNRYVGQVAKDSLNQYDGALNDTIRKKYNLTKFKYIGSEMESTRPFCSHMKDLGSEITMDQLKIALDRYCPNGVPKEGIGNGMILGTTTENFTQNRGGYNCRHRVLWLV